MPPTRPNRSLNAARESATRGLKAVEVATTAVPPMVLAKIGEAFAATLSQVLADYRAFAPEGADRRRGRLPHRLERLETLGVQMQQLARVLSGHSSGESETINLADSLRHTGENLIAAVDGAPVSVDLVVEPAEVLIDPAVLEHLITLGVTYAREFSQQLVLRCVAGVDGRPNMLAIEARRPLEAPEGPRSGFEASGFEHSGYPNGDFSASGFSNSGFPQSGFSQSGFSNSGFPGSGFANSGFPGSGLPEDEFDELNWLLLSLLARAAGLNPQRVASRSAVVLTLSFPRAERNNDPRDDALPRTPIAYGHAVLVIDADADGRRQARDALEAAGLVVDAVPTVEMARGALRDRRPEVLVTGEMIDSSEIDQFVADLRGEQPDLHWIELVSEPNVFALALPGSSVPSQLSRSEIQQSLLTAVSQQIDLNRG